MSTTLLKTFMAEAPAITPSQLTANTDNWAPTGFAGASVIRVSTDASRNLTGIAGGTSGRSIGLDNVGSNDLVLKHDVTSTAGNRFSCPNNADFTLKPGSAVLLRYDNITSRWRLIAQAQAASTLTQGYVRNLKVENNASWNTAINITASEVVLTDGNGKTCKITNLSMVDGSPGSGQVNPTGARYVFGGACDGSFGGGTWAYGYLISDGAGNYGFVWSSSYSKPSISTIVSNGYTEYTGWTFYKLLTAQYIKPAGDNLPMYQRDNRIQWKQWLAIANGSTGNLSTPTWTAVGILGVGYAAAPDAVTFMGALYGNTGGTNCMVAPNAGFGPYGNTSNGPPVGVNTPSGNGGTYVPFEFVLESSNIYWAAQGGSDRLISRGFTLNL